MSCDYTTTKESKILTKDIGSDDEDYIKSEEESDSHKNQQINSQSSSEDEVIEKGKKKQTKDLEKMLECMSRSQDNIGKMKEKIHEKGGRISVSDSNSFLDDDSAFPSH